MNSLGMTVAPGAVPAEGFVPDFSWHPISDGFTPNRNLLALQVNAETFGDSRLHHYDYDRGDGRYGVTAGYRSAGLLGGPVGATSNGWVKYRYDKTETAVSGSDGTGRQWDRHTATVADNDWNVSSRLLVGHDQLRMGGVDTPLRLRARFRLRGTPGARLYTSVSINGGAEIVPYAVRPAFVAGEVQALDLEFDWPTPLIAGGVLDLLVSFGPGNAWEAGTWFEASNVGVFNAGVYDEPDEYIFPVAVGAGSPADPQGTGNALTGGQNTLPIHRHRGIRIVDNTAAHWGLETLDLDNRSYWVGSGFALSESADPSPLHRIIPAGNPGRFWYDAVVKANGSLTLTRPFSLLQHSTPDQPSADPVADGTCQGVFQWYHMLWRRKGTNPVPGDRSFRARVRGTREYTGLCRVIRDHATSDSYHVLIPVRIGADNTDTTFTLDIEEAEGMPRHFQMCAIWPDRDRQNASAPAGLGGPASWEVMRPRFGADVSGSTAATMRRTRIDKASAWDHWNTTVFSRNWLGFDPEDMRGMPDARRKWFDTGPPASSAISVIPELRTNARGDMFISVYIDHSGGGIEAGMRKHVVTFPYLRGMLRAYDFNDFALTTDFDSGVGIRDVYVNGRFLDAATPGFEEQYRYFNPSPIVLAGPANAGASTISIQPLTEPIQAGGPNSVVTFAPSGATATILSTAAVGATTLSVVPLPAPVPAGDTTTWVPTNWKLTPFAPIWLCMDRDLTMVMVGNLTAFEIANAPQPRAAIRQRSAYLNSLPDVGRVELVE